MQSSDANKQTKQFAEYLSASRRRVFAYVMRQVGEDRTLAEDVTQDCFVRVWMTRGDNPPPSGALYSYLVKTARNILRDRHRRQADVRFAPLEKAEIAAAGTLENQFVVQETVERIATQIALMPRLLRETLHLRAVEGWDYPAIAVHMNCPVGTVRSRLNAARLRLIGALAKQEALEPAVSARTEIRYRRDTHIIYKEQTTMAASNDDSLRAQVEAMELRLRALEQGMAREPENVRVNSASDVWKAPTSALMKSMNQERKEKNSVFALGLVHMISQVADRGVEGTASGINTITSARSLPDDLALATRLERMRTLTADIALLRVFRHFYALRFEGSEMRATAEELAEATGEDVAKITALLKPLVADRTLLLVSDGETKTTYEWDGNDPTITTLLFTNP